MVAPMPRDLPATLPEIAGAIDQVLRQLGPLHDDELLEALHDAGIDLGSKDRDALFAALETEVEDVLPLLDGRNAHLPSLLDGRTFTHRLSELEVAHDLVAVTPDLAPISSLLEHRDRELVGGGTVTEALVGFDDEIIEANGADPGVLPFDTVLVLPPGTLTALGVGAGELVGVRVEGDRLALLAIDDAGLEPPPDDLAATLVGLLGGPDAECPSDLTLLAPSLVTAVPDLFRRPTWPLTDLFAVGGLVVDGDDVAPPGVDLRAWRLDRRVTSIARLHGLDEDEAVVVLGFTRLCEQARDLLHAARESPVAGLAGEAELAAQPGSTGEPVVAVDDAGASPDDLDDFDDFDDLDRPEGAISDPVLEGMLHFLETAEVAEALLAETIGADDSRAAALGLLAEILEAKAPPQARAALRWLRARANEALGCVDEAEDDLQRSHGMDPEFAPTLRDLARYASDRGDAERGLALLRRARAEPDDLLVQLLDHFRVVPRNDIGRNDRCWCGSGRKYKQCHLGHEQLPIDERAAWLYQKAGIFLDRSPFRLDLIRVAIVRAAPMPDRADALLDALEDPLVADLVLFEGGAFRAFLDQRGHLLPVDEQLLGEQWLLVDRSVYEVEAMTPGASFDVRDIRTGDRHVVRDRTASRMLKPGDLICARIVPAGDTMQVFGGIEPVPAMIRDELIRLLDEEVDPTALCEILSRRLAPPTLQNTEGEPLVFCELRLRVSDPEVVAAGLDRRYESIGPTRDDPAAASDTGSCAEREWIEQVTTFGMERIRATVRLAGDVLTVETNSEARADRVLGVVRELDPQVELLSDVRRSVADVREAASRAREPSGQESGHTSLLDSTDPEILAAVDEMIRKHEANWLDESIPALGDVTPRQAAADPTRREDLIRLLDAFDRGDHRGAMSAERLRVALGL